VETSGKIVTGKGAGVAIKFALKIVETFKGKTFAEELGRKMIFS
jgi:4-methyl-5(b-hydroxyethyl)-thiazole monophosphate biosynthesis